MTRPRLLHLGWLVPLGFLTGISLLAQEAPKGQRYALLVGVDKYEHEKLPPLRFAERDVMEMERVLRACGYAPVVMTTQAGKADATRQPSRGNIQKELANVLRGCKQADTVIVAFAGHGLQFEGQDDCFFCPTDARPFRDEAATMVSLRDVYRELDKSFAGVKIMLVDACRNDPNQTRGLRGIDADHAPRPPRGVAALFSCSDGEVSIEDAGLRHGIFFHYVLEALRGKARDDDGDVTFDSLAGYVRKQVAREVPRLFDGMKQSPNVMSDLKGAPPVLVPREPERLRPGLPTAQVQQIQKAWAQYLGRKVEEDLDLGSGVSMTMVLVPPGTFKMGSSAAEIKEAMRQFEMKEEYFKEELPSHDVEITRPILMGKYEVTKRQFGRFIAADGYKTEAEETGKGGTGFNTTSNEFESGKPIYNWKNAGFAQTDDHPVVNVSWNDADKFTAWLRGRIGQTCSLPSEAQWEYACRAGTTTLYASGNDAETVAQVGNVADSTARKKFTYWTHTIKAEDGYVFTAPVGRFRANPLGLHDLHGNVWEWCQDWYDEKYYANSPKPDPLNEQKATDRVVRGGSWNSYPWGFRAAFRGRNSPDIRDSTVGFRIVVTLPWRTP